MSGVQLSERDLHPEQKQLANVLLFQEKDGFPWTAILFATGLVLDIFQ